MPLAPGNTQTGLAVAAGLSTVLVYLVPSSIKKNTIDWYSQICYSILPLTPTFMFCLHVKYFHSIPMAPKVLTVSSKVSKVQVQSLI